MVSNMRGHRLHPTILREYDIRGIVGETLNEDDVRAIGRSYGTMLQTAGAPAGSEVCVGYDGRTSSPALEAALIEGLTAAGLDVCRVGRGPTPMLYFASHVLAAAGGLMVTGSHNPPQHNGIKMVMGGKPFYGESIQALGDVAASADFAGGNGAVRDEEIAARYVARLLKDFRSGASLSVAWDPGNGAAGEIVQEVTKALPGHHSLINEVIDGSFPNHHPDPTVEANLEQLKAAVAEAGCDIGIGFDGDGDRIGVIDAAGRVLWGDQLLIIFARDVLARQPGAPIIADVKASQALFDEVARAGGVPTMWKAGHSLIKSKMVELEAPLAGEMSGHIFFADQYYGYDDAIYAAIRLLSILGNADQSLAEMRDALPQFINTPELRFECPEERKFAVIDEVRDRLGEVAGLTVRDMDGVRVETEDGWWLLRASNTQSVLVARCEASDSGGLDRLRDMLSAQLAASGMSLPDFD